MPQYMLDTDIASYGFEHRDATLDNRLKFVAPSSLCISSVTAAELLYGSRRFPQGHTSRVNIEAFVDRARILSWDLAAAEAYADIRHSLTRSSRVIKDLDMMIAAHAIATDSILVTNNTRHFLRLTPPLHLENWTEA